MKQPEISQVLISARETAGISRRTLADELGVSDMSIWNSESGYDTSIIYDILKYFKIKNVKYEKGGGYDRNDRVRGKTPTKEIPMSKADPSPMTTLDDKLNAIAAEVKNEIADIVRHRVMQSDINIMELLPKAITIKGIQSEVNQSITVLTAKVVAKLRLDDDEEEYVPERFDDSEVLETIPDVNFIDGDPLIDDSGNEILSVKQMETIKDYVAHNYSTDEIIDIMEGVDRKIVAAYVLFCEELGE